MRLSSKKAIFSTPNTALAAYLISEGFELTDKDTSNPSHIVFIFHNSSVKLSELVHAFNIGKATGNIATFYHIYRELIDLTRREKRLYGNTQVKGD